MPNANETHASAARARQPYVNIPVICHMGTQTIVPFVFVLEGSRDKTVKPSKSLLVAASQPSSCGMINIGTRRQQHENTSAESPARKFHEIKNDWANPPRWGNEVGHGSNMFPTAKIFAVETKAARKWRNNIEKISRNRPRRTTMISKNVAPR